MGTGLLALLVGVSAGACGARGSTGVGVARAMTARERKAVNVLNCIFAVGIILKFGLKWFSCVEKFGVSMGASR